jgi:hypothetical protein
MGCLSGYTKCDLTFTLVYRIVGGSNQSLGSWREIHDGDTTSIDIDLSFLAGKKVEFMLRTVCNNKYPGNAHGYWRIPRIVQVAPSPTSTSNPTSTATPTATPTPTYTQSVSTPTPTATNTSGLADWMELISSSPSDGFYSAPGTTFLKTWMAKNIGTGTWTTDYDLVFISGTQMTALGAVPLPKTVPPGETINLSLSLVSPITPGIYQGLWMLRNDEGDLFGSGQDADDPLIAKTTVLNVNPHNSYDFLLNYCEAQWWNSSGEQISCEGTINDVSGFVILDPDPILEDGLSDKPVLWVHPENEPYGTMSGRFPAYTVSTGDHFNAKVGCMGGYPSCNITFKLLYRIGNNPNQLLGTWQETYGGGIITIDIDLSFLAGQKVQFILRTIASSTNPSDAQGFWMIPGIEFIEPTPTPTTDPDATPIPTDIPLSRGTSDHNLHAGSLTIQAIYSGKAS